MQYLFLGRQFATRGFGICHDVLISVYVAPYLRPVRAKETEGDADEHHLDPAKRTVGEVKRLISDNEQVSNSRDSAQLGVVPNLAVDVGKGLPDVRRERASGMHWIKIGIIRTRCT